MFLTVFSPPHLLRLSVFLHLKCTKHFAFAIIATHESCESMAIFFLRNVTD